VAAFMTLVPRKVMPFTHLGATALAVYAWHPFILRAFQGLQLSWVLGRSLPRALIAAAVITALLGFGPMAKFTMRVFGGKGLKKAPAGGSAKPQTQADKRRAARGELAPQRRS
jgi:fucose 4-O-acetylase-like acetyltransferase